MKRQTKAKDLAGMGQGEKQGITAERGLLHMGRSHVASKTTQAKPAGNQKSIVKHGKN